MKPIGSLLFLFGAASSVLYFMDYNLKLLAWMNDMPEIQQWLIRGGLMVVGAALWLIGNKKEKESATPNS